MRLVRDGADEIAGSEARASSAADEEADPRSVGPRPTGIPNRRAARARDRSPADGATRRRAPRPDRRPGREGRRRELDIVDVLPAGAFDQADGGEGDVDEVELIGQRLDDAAEAIISVAEERLAQVRPEDLRPALAQVGHGGQVGDLELHVCRRLDVAQHPVLARLDERDRDTLAPGPAGPSDPVDIGVRVGRDVVVDDVRDVVDIEPPGGHIRGHEDVE